MDRFKNVLIISFLLANIIGLCVWIFSILK
ncbi:hypothetical protein QF028_005873 [Neobacillus sp. B4I6]